MLLNLLTQSELQMKIFSIIFGQILANASILYSLDDDSVNLTVTGGEWSNDYLLENAFDKNEESTYHSKACAKNNPEKGFVWEFGRTIQLLELSIVTRKDCCRDRYNKVCV